MAALKITVDKNLALAYNAIEPISAKGMFPMLVRNGEKLNR
jgi:hypothetical protein